MCHDFFLLLAVKVSYKMINSTVTKLPFITNVSKGIGRDKEIKRKGIDWDF